MGNDRYPYGFDYFESGFLILRAESWPRKDGYTPGAAPRGRTWPARPALFPERVLEAPPPRSAPRRAQEGARGRARAAHARSRDWPRRVTSRRGPGGRRERAPARAQTQGAEGRGEVAGRFSRVRHFVAVALGSGVGHGVPGSAALPGGLGLGAAAGLGAERRGRGTGARRARTERRLGSGCRRARLGPRPEPARPVRRPRSKPAARRMLRARGREEGAGAAL
ncbi:unnamed protein product [Rangifer tarandus platyrhynchus]|uniref:Uncharacterized protein n=1 Tax=Rangifer tarandus platyrhynchus TaxID=3082113 RepID=A0ABN8Y7T5_RANTA|nr:unnamed protein product [Rangifer tarandus platyrhynchus]